MTTTDSLTASDLGIILDALAGHPCGLAEKIRRLRDARLRYEAAATDASARIRAAYRLIAAEPGEFVRLAALRLELADLPRADVDAALDLMYRGQQINLIPQSNRRELTGTDQIAALRIGGEDKHLISIEPR